MGFWGALVADATVLITFSLATIFLMPWWFILVALVLPSLLDFWDNLITGVIPETPLFRMVHNALGRLLSASSSSPVKLPSGAWITHYQYHHHHHHHRKADQYVVLYIHGRGISRDSFLHIHRYGLFGSDVIALDVRKFRTCHVDISEAHAYARASGKQILVVAESLGVLMFARFVKAHGETFASRAILCAGPSSLADGIASYPFVRWFIDAPRAHRLLQIIGYDDDDVNVTDALRGRCKDVTLVHGDADQVVPIGHHHRITDALTDDDDVRAVTIADAGHHNLVCSDGFKMMIPSFFE